METFTYPSKTGVCDICAHKWLPDGELAAKPKAVIQIAHGMAEHSKRYDDIANYLTGLGYVVYANDHAGHGESINGKGEKGFFAEKDGWSCVVEDMRTLHDISKREYPSTKMVLYGHSMGSFLARTYASRFPDDFDAFIFSGTAGRNPAIGIAKLMAKLQIKKNGLHGRSHLLNKLAFGAYNKRVKDPKSINSWLSTREDIVTAYDQDDLCGFSFTCAAYRDLFDGLDEISGMKWANKVKNVPIYLLAGTDDPVGNYGKGVIEVCETLKKAGKTKVVLQLYNKGRHEMHNESNRQEVYRGIAAFLKSI